MRILSGGQTGVDRGALDAAIQLDIPHGGWCPRGRRAEDGRIAPKYRLRQVTSPEYWVRTERNVIDADATLILHHGPLSGGTEFTYRMTVKHRRPCLLVDLTGPLDWQAYVQWLIRHNVNALNCAGPRESSAPGVQQQALEFFLQLLPRWAATRDEGSGPEAQKL